MVCCFHLLHFDMIHVKEMKHFLNIPYNLNINAKTVQHKAGFKNMPPYLNHSNDDLHSSSIDANCFMFLLLLLNHDFNAEVVMIHAIAYKFSFNTYTLTDGYIHFTG